MALIPLPKTTNRKKRKYHLISFFWEVLCNTLPKAFILKHWKLLMVVVPINLSFNFRAPFKIECNIVDCPASSKGASSSPCHSTAMQEENRWHQERASEHQESAPTGRKAVYTSWWHWGYSHLGPLPAKWNQEKWCVCRSIESVCHSIQSQSRILCCDD